MFRGVHQLASACRSHGDTENDMCSLSLFLVVVAQLHDEISKAKVYAWVLESALRPTEETIKTIYLVVVRLVLFCVLIMCACGR